jgi:predicted nucleotidyltransferase
MRIKQAQKLFFRKAINAMLPDADIFLFGSRANDQLKGGDIDILVIGKDKLSFQQIRNLKISFYKQFGQQKIDIATFKRDEQSTFCELALLDAVRL